MYFESWIVLRSLEQPYSITIEYKDGYQVGSVCAEGRPAYEVDDDIAPSGFSNITRLIRQLCHSIAGDAAGGKGEGCFVCQAEWNWLMRTCVGQGSSVQAHAFAEAPRATGE